MTYPFDKQTYDHYNIFGYQSVKTLSQKKHKLQFDGHVQTMRHEVPIQRANNMIINNYNIFGYPSVRIHRVVLSQREHVISMRVDCRVQALRDDVRVRQSVVFDSARGEALERRILEGVYYSGEVLSRRLEDIFRSFAFEVDGVYVGAVVEERAHYFGGTRVQLERKKSDFYILYYLTR